MYAPVWSVLVLLFRSRVSQAVSYWCQALSQCCAD